MRGYQINVVRVSGVHSNVQAFVRSSVTVQVREVVIVGRLVYERVVLCVREKSGKGESREGGDGNRRESEQLITSKMTAVVFCQNIKGKE